MVERKAYTAFGETEFGEMGFGKTGFGETGHTVSMCGFNSKMIHFELLDSFDRQKFKFCKSKMAADAILKIEK